MSALTFLAPANGAKSTKRAPIAPSSRLVGAAVSWYLFYIFATLTLIPQEGGSSPNEGGQKLKHPVTSRAFFIYEGLENL